MLNPADGLSAVPAVVSSLGIGLLIGMERERIPGTNAGLRSFALVAMSGTVCALLAQSTGSSWLIPVALLVLGLMMISVNLQRPLPDGDPGTTTTIALLLCFCFGAMTWYGYTSLAVALALITTVLLYFRSELHGITRHLSRQDLISLLQFTAITFVVLPVLPNQGYGPYQALNPYRIWLMVVLISGVSLVGYAALRILGSVRAIPLLGLLGGAVSSTATTLVYAKHVLAQVHFAPVALIIILLANVMVLVRLAILTAIVGPGALTDLLPILIAGVFAGLILPLWAWRQNRTADTPALIVGNPAELGTALGFAAFYVLTLLVVSWTHAHAGIIGVYGVALLSGLADVDAITLSSLQLFQSGAMTAHEVSICVTCAYCSNMVFKIGLVRFIAGRPLACKVASGYFMVFLSIVVVAVLAS